MSSVSNVVPQTLVDFNFPNIVCPSTTFIVGGVKLGQIIHEIQKYLENPSFPLDVVGFRPVKTKWKLKGYEPNLEVNAAILRLRLFYSQGLFAVEIQKRRGDCNVLYNLFLELRSRCLQIPNAIECSADGTVVPPTEYQIVRWTYTAPTMTLRPNKDYVELIFEYINNPYYETVLAGVSMCARGLLEDPEELGDLIGRNDHFRIRLFELLGNEWDCVDIKRCAAIALKSLTRWIQRSDLQSQGLWHPFHQLILRQNDNCDLETLHSCEFILQSAWEQLML